MIKSMGKLFLSALIFCSVIFGLQSIGTGKSTEDMIIARIEVPAMMLSAQHLSGLAEEISPNSSALIGVGITALAFNPSFRYFDLTKPFQVLFFPPSANDPENLRFGFLFFAKQDDIPAVIDDGKSQLYVRRHKDYCLVGKDAEIVKLDIPELPGNEHPEFDLLLEFFPANYISEAREHYFNFRHGMMRNALQFVSPEDAETVRNAKIANLRFSQLEKIMKQIVSFRNKISFSKDGLKIEGSVMPVPGSAMEKFFLAQDGISGADVTMPENGIWRGALNIKTDKMLISGIIDFLRLVAIEGADRVDDDYFACLESILNAANGKINFASDNRISENDKGKDQFSIFRLYVDDITGFGELFSAAEVYKDHPVLGLKCFSETENIIIISGKLKDKDLIKYAMDGKNISLSGGEAMFYYYPVKSPETEPMEFNIMVNSGNGLINIKIPVSSLKASEISENILPKTRLQLRP